MPSKSKTVNPFDGFPPEIETLLKITQQMPGVQYHLAVAVRQPDGAVKSAIFTTLVLAGPEGKPIRPTLGMVVDFINMASGRPEDGIDFVDKAQEPRMPRHKM